MELNFLASSKGFFKRHKILIVIALFLFLVLHHLWQQYWPKNEYHGYVEGRFRYIGSEVPGRLYKLNIRKGDQVQEGQSLFTLTPEPHSTQYKRARAELDQATSEVTRTKASLDLAKITLHRQESLYKQKVGERANVDSAHAAFLQAEAQWQQSQQAVSAAQQRLAELEWQMSEKTIKAPKTGRIFDTLYLPGEVIGADKPVVVLLGDGDVRVNFFVSERDLTSLTVGQRVDIECDGCEENISAKIRYISAQAEFTPPVIYSDDTRSKLVFRVEAYPENQIPQLHPGLPVSVHLK